MEVLHRPHHVPRRFYVLCTVFTVSSLLSLILVVGAHDHHTPAFIQTDNELKYLVDGISVQLQESPQDAVGEQASCHSGYATPSNNINNRNTDDGSRWKRIVFDPPFLDFKEHPVGMPYLSKVTVMNPSDEASLHLYSISGSTVHFHCSFFQDKVITAEGNTTFDVVFLGREEGFVNNTLHIHTSVGSFKYQVQGVGISNPYRLRPFLGARVPLNSIYSPIISMHNPHNHTLQVLEMYSSGGDLHLELPSGEDEASSDLWEIAPYQTKEVMRASFIAREESNHTAYIRIRTNTTDDYLVLPVEVEVSSSPGIYTPVESLDFGVMSSEDKPRTLDLHLLNHGQKFVQIQSVMVNPTNEAISIEFKPIKVPVDTLHPTHVASITFDPARSTHSKYMYGKIIVRAKGSPSKVAVPFTAHVLHGSLIYNASNTRFLTGSSVVRNVTVCNTFNVSVIVHSVEVTNEATEYLRLRHHLPVTLRPGETATVCDLHLTTPRPHLSTHLILRTNITDFHVPVVAYSGALTVEYPVTTTAGKLDFGTLALAEKRVSYITLKNNNPVEVLVKSIRTNMARANIEFVAVTDINVTDFKKLNDSTAGKLNSIQPGQTAILRLTVRSSDSEEGDFTGEATVETQYERMIMEFTLRTTRATITPPSGIIKFSSVFPGKVVSMPLTLRSTFPKAMSVLSVSSFPHDNRLTFLLNERVSLKPNISTRLGTIFFDAHVGCNDECYASFPLTSNIGRHWLTGLSLPKDIGHADKKLYHSLRERWVHAVNVGQHHINFTVQVDTSDIKGYLIPGKAVLQWPTIFSKPRLRFPLTQIGNLTVKEVTIENPTSASLLLHLILLPHHPNSELVLEMLRESDVISYLESIDSSPSALDSFSIGFPKDRPPPSAYIGNNQLDDNSGVLLLAPGEKVKVSVFFHPKDEGAMSTAIILRNNLNVVDALLLVGQGGRGVLKFGNRSPGSSTPLLFELTEKLLKDCELAPGPSRCQPPNFTVKRTITARNAGPLAVFVSSFEIGGSPCEGYGFRIMNCQSFHLAPNASKKVDVAFTPDFTMSVVDHELILHSSVGELRFAMRATVPLHMVGRCAAAVPRPTWEPLVYYACCSLVVLFLFCTFLVGYLEADRLFRGSFVAMTVRMPTVPGTVWDDTKVLDLRQVGKQDIGEPEMRAGSKDTRHKASDHEVKPHSHGISTATEIFLKELASHHNKKGQRDTRSQPTMQDERHPTHNNKRSNWNHKNQLKWKDIGEGIIADTGAHETRAKLRRRSKIEITTVKVSDTETRENPPPSTHIEEETSSTTTESSNTDDASTSEKDQKSSSSSDPPSFSAMRCSTRSKKNTLPVNNEDDTKKAPKPEVHLDLTSFQTTKYKSRRSRGSHQETRKTDTTDNNNQGDNTEDSVELPYRPEKGVSGTERQAAIRWHRVHLQGRRPIVHQLRLRAGSHLGGVTDTDSSDRSKDSPPPLWDHSPGFSNPVAVDEAFSELANQTQTFALKRSLLDSGSPPTTKAAVGHRTSYSAVVSAGAELTTKSPPMKAPAKKMASFPLEGRSGSPGPIGSVPSTGMWSAKAPSPMLGSPSTPPNSELYLGQTSTAPLLDETSLAALAAMFGSSGEGYLLGESAWQILQQKYSNPSSVSIGPPPGFPAWGQGPQWGWSSTGQGLALDQWIDGQDGNTAARFGDVGLPTSSVAEPFSWEDAGTSKWPLPESEKSQVKYSTASFRTFSPFHNVKLPNIWDPPNMDRCPTPLLTPSPSGEALSADSGDAFLDNGITGWTNSFFSTPPSSPPAAIHDDSNQTENEQNASGEPWNDRDTQPDDQ